MTKSRHIMRNRIRLHAGALASTILLGTLCARAASPTVVIGYENNGADPYQVTQELGLFQKMIHGNVSLKYFDSGPAAMGALASNSLQFMCGIGIPPLVAGVSQGLPLAIIYNQERYTTSAGLIVRADSGIHSLADLKGHKLAIVQGSQASFELSTFLDAAKIPYDSVPQLNMSPPQMRVAWATQNIDAAIVWDPVFSALKGMGGLVIKTDADLPRDASSYNVCIANTKWVAANPTIAVEFVKAMDAGVAYTHAHPNKAMGLMAKGAGVKVDAAKSELAGYETFSGKDQLSANVLGNGEGVATSATTKTLENTAKVLLKIGRITTVLKNPVTAVDSTPAATAFK